MSDIRRVVTGHDARGKAIVIADGINKNVVKPPNRPGVLIQNFWVETKVPSSVAGNADAAPPDKKLGLEPPAGGHVLRIVEFPPEKDWIDKVDREAAKASFASLGASHAADSAAKPPHPLMHKTKTIDYAIVLSGEIYLVLDESEVLLKAGDVCIQRGTNHAWSNRSSDYCRICFVLIDGTFD